MTHKARILLALSGINSLFVLFILLEYENVRLQVMRKYNYGNLRGSGENQKTRNEFDLRS